MNQTQKPLQPSCLIVVGTEKASSEQNFDFIVLDTLDALLSSLGCKQEVFHQLNEKYAINYQAISKNIKAFTIALEKIFGEASSVLEIKMMRLLHEKVPNFKYRSGKEELLFSSYLEKLYYWLARDCV
jgi:hypothetical protein